MLKTIVLCSALKKHTTTSISQHKFDHHELRYKNVFINDEKPGYKFAYNENFTKNTSPVSAHRVLVSELVNQVRQCSIVCSQR